MSKACPSCGVRNLAGEDQCGHCGADLRSIDLPEPSSRLETTVMELPLTALPMTQSHAIAPDTPLEVAIHALFRQHVDIVEIVDDGRLIGLLSVRDILMRVGPGYRDKLQQPVSRFMTPNPETLPPEAPVSYALNKMDVGGYRHVPIVQDGRMVGVVSARGVISFLIRIGREPTAK